MGNLDSDLNPAHFVKLNKDFLIRTNEITQGQSKKYIRATDLTPAHSVKLTKGFWMGTHEITRGQFKKFIRETKYKTDAEIVRVTGLWVMSVEPSWKHPPAGFGIPRLNNRHPAICIAWKDATAFCRWLSQKEGKKYRLPTEAEWEYACRAGSSTQYNTGKIITNDQANYWRDEKPDGSYHIRDRKLMEVGSYEPNAWGLYDMHGNVAELCIDWFGPYPSGNVVDPQGPPSGETRVYRGGSWMSLRADCSSHKRKVIINSYADDRSHGKHERWAVQIDLGFRIVLEVSE